MGRQLFTAMIALAALPSLALGQGGYNPPTPAYGWYHGKDKRPEQTGEKYNPTPPASLPTIVPASQEASEPLPIRAESAPRAGSAIDSKPGADVGEPCDKADSACCPPWACSPPSCFWVSGEYLRWWIKKGQVPALITTGAAGSTASPGVLGQSDTRVLFGGPNMDNQVSSGGRFSGGVWLDCCHTIGLEASFFFLGSRQIRFDAASDGTRGSSLISRPFFDVLTGTQNAELVAFPALAGGTNILTASGTGLASGDIHAFSYNRLQGGDLNAFCNVCSGCDYWVQMLGGVRYLQFNEGLGITETTRVNATLPAGSPFFGGSTINIADQFDTRNIFYGGQVGLRAEICSGRMFVQVQSKVALGVTNETVDIHGSTAITSPAGTTVVTPAGFLATASNSGHFTRNRFAVVPEVGINVGCQVTRHLRAFVGYNFLYWSSVARVGDQIDVGLSGTQIPTDSRYNPQAGPARPAVLLRSTDFWAHGINFGLELRF